MRDLMKALSAFEFSLHSSLGVTLNEAMAMCCIGQETVTSTFVSENTGMAPSSTSKVLRVLEDKNLVSRTLGQKDRRCMYFTLTSRGRDLLYEMKNADLPVPELLQPLFA